MILDSRRIAWLSLSVALVGCSGVAAVHPPSVRPEQLDAEQARDQIGTLVRSTRPARNVAVEATLWETSLLAAELGAEEPLAQDELARWYERDILETTTFTVLVEFEQRLGDPASMDPVLDPRSWSFSLERGGRVLDPRSVELQAVDRFPMETVGHHWRLALTVRFPGNLHRTTLEHGPAIIVLRVRMPSIEGPRRERLGRHLSSRGVSLRWRLEPAAGGSGT